MVRKKKIDYRKFFYYNRKEQITVKRIMDELIALVSKKYKIDLKKDVELLKLKLPYCGAQEGCKKPKI